MYSMHPGGFLAVAAYPTILCIYVLDLFNVGPETQPGVSSQYSHKVTSLSEM